MIIGRDNLTAWMRANNILFYRIKTPGTNGAVYHSYGKEGGRVDDTVADIETTLNWLASGRYHIEASEKDFSDKSATKQRFNPMFEHVNSGSGNNIAGIGSAHPQVDVQAEIAKALLQYKKECEVEALKKEVVELKKEVKEKKNEISGLEKSEPWKRIVGRLLPAIDIALDKAGIPQATEEATALSGNEKISAEQYTERLEKAFENWDEADEQTKLILLEKISSMSKTDKAKYGMARNILLKSS